MANNGIKLVNGCLPKINTVPSLTSEEKSSRGIEIPVDGTLWVGHTPYKVIQAPHPANCKGCDFREEGGLCNKPKLSPCTAYSRSDKTWVIFKRTKTNGKSK